MNKNPYLILGLIAGASEVDIRKAYKAMAKAHHPDVGGDPEKFHEIDEAYNFLIDEKNRKLYASTGVFNPNHGGEVTRCAIEMLTKMVIEGSLQPIKFSMEMLKEQITRFKAQALTTFKELTNIQKTLSSIVTKKHPLTVDDPIYQAFTAIIETKGIEVKQLEYNAQVATEAIKFLSDYSMENFTQEAGNHWRIT